MDNLLKIAKTAFFFSLCVLCVCAADTLKHVRATTDTATTTLLGLNRTLSDLDRAVVSTDFALNAKGGILDTVHATALHVDRAAGEAAIASRQQRAAAEKMDGEIANTIQHVNIVADSLAGNIRGTTEDVHNALVRVPPMLDAATTTLTSANAVISNTDVTGTLRNLDSATKEFGTTLQHVSGTTAHLETMSGDLERSLHKTLNPTKKSVALGWVLTTLKLGTAMAPLY